MNSPRPVVDKVVNFRLGIKLKIGDVLIELPVAEYILKDGKPEYSNFNSYTQVQQQHYDFNYSFNEPGAYSLVVDIKDIFYTLNIASVDFVIVVDGSLADRITKLIGSYYYTYIFQLL